MLVVMHGSLLGMTYAINDEALIVGRTANLDIPIDDDNVSRRHAEFRLGDGDFQVVDVGSLNGTYVNREPVDVATLGNGDEVQIGKYRLQFLTGGEQPEGDS